MKSARKHMRSLWNWMNSGIQRKLMLTYLLVIVVPLSLTSMFLYRGAVSIVTQQTEKNNYKLLQLMNEKIDQFISQVDRVSNFVYLDDVQKMLNDRPIDLISRSSWQLQLTNKFNNWIGFMEFQGGIRGVALIDNQGVYFQTAGQMIKEGTDLINASWYNQTLSSDGKQIIFGQEEVDAYFKFTPIRQRSLNFVIARKVFNLAGNRPLGILVAEVELYDMDKLMDKLGIDQSTGFVIVSRPKEIMYEGGNRSADSQVGRILAASGYKCANTFQEPTTRMMVNSFQSSTTDWCYVTLTDSSVLSAGANKLNSVVAIIGLLGFVAAMLISLIFSRGIVIPIKRLQASMKNVAKHNFRSSIPVNSTDEVGQLTETFNQMVAHIRLLIQTVYQAEIKEKEANLRALQAQINPHFLYNTLDTINSMAVVEDQWEISRMVVALAEMFQYAAQQKDKLVTIRDELIHLKSYVTIQNCRYGERIRFAIDIPEALMDSPIICLVLQPLVENAISHGLENQTEGGLVEIIGCVEGSVIRITVKDNGTGIQELRLRYIQSRLAYTVTGAEKEDKSIGLINVNERLKLSFGEEYGASIKSRWGQGTTVTISIPAMKQKTL